ncbi:YceI family protein [Luteimonas terricola]|uniref:YceI family protein n=1 Tax=Luteimonas terricola TaxID=645597 RepID=UPI0014055BCF|nr:YceI family protein [Luteimonas terricola]
MSRAGLHPCVLLVVALLLVAAPVRAAEIDPLQSEVGFSLVTRWGEVVDGRFPVFNGHLSDLGDGRQQVRLSLSAADVEILGSLRHTHLTRGRGFFEADRYPTITFVSDPFFPALLVEGGALPGVLNIRDVQRREVFTTLPSACGRPAVDCPVLAAGIIDRGDYGMTRWSFAIGRKVRFQLRIRAGGEAQ